MREAKEPRFEKDKDVVIDELKSLRNFENARVKWSTRSVDRKTVDILAVELVNGQGMIDDENKLRQLGKEALQLTLPAIENESEYERFEVIFIQESRRGILTNTYTRAVQYSPDELK